ncbi:transcriptional regulator, GntR family [Prescottella equi ATCC 33707]|uniref:Transcriptional regulator, GntR family n=1 Tax=Prescottella equi ATCC 33707 TaxID=525370 RepID=E9T776_RHOHA|nr:transcriptional regulator, GntR family [Prescottella equi ATCC 33707]
MGRAESLCSVTDPQHVLLAQDLISRIQSGEFAVGDKLPTELELCQTRSLARGTVRQALKHLEDAGMISRRRGAGTTVESPEPVVGHQAFVTSSLGMLAFVERTRITAPSSEIIVAESNLAKRVGVPVGSEWYRVSGPRVVRGSVMPPFCWSEVYLRSDLPHRRMVLTGRFGIANLVRQRIEQVVTGTLLASDLADALDAEKGSAALVVTHRHVDANGALEAVGIHTHPAERYRIVTSVGAHLSTD